MDEFLIFGTFYEENQDYSVGDSLQQMQALLTRQVAIEDCLTGKTEADYLLDLLAQQGINPDEYVNTVVENVEFVIANELPVDQVIDFYGSNTAGLF